MERLEGRSPCRLSLVAGQTLLRLPAERSRLRQGAAVCPPPWVPQALLNEAKSRCFHFRNQSHQTREDLLPMHRVGGAFQAPTAAESRRSLPFSRIRLIGRSRPESCLSSSFPFDLRSRTRTKDEEDGRTLVIENRISSSPYRQDSSLNLER